VLSLASIIPDGEGLEPRFDGFELRVPKRILKRRGSSFYLTEDTFDGVPISVATHLKSEAKSARCCFQIVRTVNEKRRLVDGVLLPEFTQEQTGSFGCSRLKQPDVKQLVHGWIDGGVQPFDVH
jgi:hypothetical protein